MVHHLLQHSFNSRYGLQFAFAWAAGRSFVITYRDWSWPFLFAGGGNRIDATGKCLMTEGSRKFSGAVLCSTDAASACKRAEALIALSARPHSLSLVWWGRKDSAKKKKSGHTRLNISRWSPSHSKQYLFIILVRETKPKGDMSKKQKRNFITHGGTRTRNHCLRRTVP